MKIFLDDIREAPDETWFVARTPLAAILFMMENEDIEILSLDHDLAYEHVVNNEVKEVTGYDVIKKVEEWAHHGWWTRVPQSFAIHSANPVGRKNMQAAIDSIERMRHAA